MPASVGKLVVPAARIQKAAGWSRGRLAPGEEDVFGLRGQRLHREELGQEQVLLQAVED